MNAEQSQTWLVLGWGTVREYQVLVSEWLVVKGFTGHAPPEVEFYLPQLSSEGINNKPITLFLAL